MPPRPKGSYLSNKNKLFLDTNLFKISFDEKTAIRIYAVRINPMIQYDNRELRIRLLNKALVEIRDEIGEYVINANTVYACYNQTSKDVYNCVVSENGTNYEMNFRAVRTVNLQDIHSSDNKKAGVPFGFLNNLVKTFLMKLDYQLSLIHI